MQKKNFSSILIFLFLALEGATYNIVPASSLFVTDIYFLNLSLQKYGWLFVALGIGGGLGAYISSRCAERYGTYKLFFFSVLCYLIGFFLIGAVFISVLFKTLDALFFSLAHFFVGIGVGISLPILFTMILSLYPGKNRFSLMVFSIGIMVGAWIASYFFLEHHMTLVVLTIASLFLILFFLFDLFVDFPKALDTELRAASVKGLTSLRISIVLVAILDALFINWSILYFLRVKHLVSAEVIHVQMMSLSFLILSRIFFSVLLAKVSFRWIYMIVPFALFLASVLFTISNDFFLSLMFGTFGFLYSALFPSVFIAASLKYPLRITYVLGELFAIFLITAGFSATLLGLFQGIEWFFPIGASVSFLLFLVNIKEFRSLKN